METQDKVQVTIVYHLQSPITYQLMPDEAQRLSDDFSGKNVPAGTYPSDGTYQVTNAEGMTYPIYLDFCRINAINPVNAG